jgi:hypothetical protein
VTIVDVKEGHRKSFKMIMELLRKTACFSGGDLQRRM